MMHLQELHSNLKQYSDKWGVFPNTKEQAYYSFISQTVHVPSLDAESISPHIKHYFAQTDGFSYQQYELVKKMLSLFQHEYTHWIDNVSTIWGTEILLDIYYVFLLRQAERFNIDRSNEYYKIKNLCDKFRCMCYSDYYTTKTNVENQFPWRVNYSLGRLFTKDGKLSQYPIYFTRFSNLHNNELICRVPFSISSILEASALAQETCVNLIALSMLDEDDFLVEKASYNEQLNNILYNPNLAVYNVAVHHLANCMKISNIPTAFKVSATLARFVLNFPRSLFPRICIPYRHIEKMGFQHYAEHIFESFQIAFSNSDRAALYFLMASLMPDVNYVENINREQIITYIKDVINEINLDFEDIQDESQREICVNFEELSKYDISMAKYISHVGYNNFNSLNLFGDYPYFFYNLSPVSAILGDDSLFNISVNSNHIEFDILDFAFESLDIYVLISDFEKACIL